MKPDTRKLHSNTVLSRIARLKRNFNFIAEPDLSQLVVHFNISIEASVNKQEEKIIKTIEIGVVSETSSKLAEFIFEFHFKVSGLGNYVRFRRSDFKIDNELNLWLNNVVIATSRGIVYAELQGTALADFIIPLTNPDLVS